jgi:putative inorganic carbon (HCO3(-)) transporter
MDWLQAGVLLAVSPLFLFPSMERAWIFLVIPLLWLGRRIIGKRILERTLLDLGIFLLATQVLVTCLIVPNLAVSLPKVAGVIYGIAVFYALVALLNAEKRLKAGVVTFLAGGLAFSLIGLVGMLPFKAAKYADPLVHLRSRIPFLDLRLPGAEEGFHPNAVGGILILILPMFIVSVYQYLRAGKKGLILQNRFFPLFSCIGLIVMGGTLLLTQSRGSLLGLAIGGWIFVLQFMYKGRTIVISTGLFAVAVIVLLGILFVKPAAMDRYAGGTMEVSGKVLARTSLWAVGLETVNEHPLTGIGMNQIRLKPEVGYKISQVHNHFIQTAAELGVPGLISLLMILGGAGVLCVRAWRRTDQTWIRMTILGLAWGQAAQLVFGLNDSIPLGAKPGIFLWVSLALIVSAFNIVDRPKRTA